jgi:ABC-2 type transport system permease protein
MVEYNIMQGIFRRYRYSLILLRQLVVTDFKLRYQGSVLGYVWSLLRPLALFIILYLVFGVVFKAGDAIPYFPVYLLTGIVLWNYFAEVTTGSVGAIVAKGDLLRKINFPKYVIVLANSFGALINLFLNFIVIAVFMIINHVPLRVEVIYLPILVAELFVFSLALGFLLSSIYVRFRDINYIWEVVMQAAFYATPILYPISLVLNRSELAGKILMLNPIAQIIQDVRYVLVTPSTQTIAQIYGTRAIRLVPFVGAIVLVIIAAWYFKKRSKYFAEEV